MAFLYSYFLILSLVILILAPLSILAASEDEFFSLRSLFFSTGGEDWVWDNSGGVKWHFNGSELVDPCSDMGGQWEGVVCSLRSASICAIQQCSVIQLILSNKNLIGTMPNDLSGLQSLQVLDLSINSLTSTIPDSLFNINSLTYLYMNDNDIRGPIPTSVGNSHELVEIRIQRNELSKSLPSSLGKLVKLKLLYLHLNQLTGVVPDIIGNLIQLQTLFLYNNDLVGSIPDSIGGLQQLVQFDLSNNRMTGPIPYSMGGLSSLTYFSMFNNHLSGSLSTNLMNLDKIKLFDLHTNDLTGSIPNSIGNLQQLERLILNDNEFVGVIPNSVGDMKALLFLDLEFNFLTGYLPTSFGELTNLRTLDVSDNFLIGSFPGEVVDMKSLLFFDLNDNILTSSIPSAIGKLTQIKLLLLHGNEFTRTIPRSIGSLLLLDSLWVHNNKLSGSLPSSLGSLSLLTILDGRNNLFSGQIPSEIGAMAELAVLHLHSNKIDGHIPSSIGFMSKLIVLDLNSNLLTGTIPEALGKLSRLEQLRLQSNCLSGSLLQHWHTVGLINLDVSSNMITGEIPSSLFYLPYLSTVALSVNCFRGELPSAICNGTNIEVLSMDGLSASHCIHEDRPIFAMLFADQITGSVPSCIFVMENLKVLHLASNELTGNFNNADLNPVMVNLSLSHNHLSGTIPQSILQHSFTELDLSYNKITGEYLDELGTGSIVMKVNRLSGNLVTLSNLEDNEVQDISILEGNMFSCNHVPDSDEYAEYYTCGSLLLDFSLYLFGALAGFTIAFICYFIALCHSADYIGLNYCKEQIEKCAYMKELNDFLIYQMSFISHCVNKTNLTLSNSSANKLKGFQLELQLIAEVVSKVTIAGLLLCLPIILLKALDLRGQSKTYLTHHHVYNWLFSVAFTSGDQVAGMLLLICCLQLCFLSGALVNKKLKLEALMQLRSESTTKIVKDEVTARNGYIRFIQLTSVILFNIAVVVLVYGYYVSTLHRNILSEWRRVIQISVALFLSLYNSFGVPVLMRLPQSNEQQAELAYFWVLIFNHLLAPAMVIATSSPDCFKGLFVPADQISSFYMYSFCNAYILSDPVQCNNYVMRIEQVGPFVPLFHYNYQCASVILTSFIPVFIYTYLMKLAVPILFVALQSNARRFPSCVLKVLDQLALPQVLLVDSILEISNRNDSQQEHISIIPGGLLNSGFIINRMMSDVAMLATFGLCCPFLGLAIGLSIVVSACQWCYVCGRFVKTCEEDNTQQLLPHQLISDLGNAVTKGYQMFDECLWPIVLISVVFFGLIAYDMSADRSGNVVAIWTICVAFAAIPLSVYLFQYIYVGNSRKHQVNQNDTLFDEVVNPISLHDAVTGGEDTWISSAVAMNLDPELEIEHQEEGAGSSGIEMRHSAI